MSPLPPGFPPPAHPESMTAELPGEQEEWLAAVADAMWPGDEYVAIVGEFVTIARPGDEDGGEW